MSESRVEKSNDAFRTIGEVSEELDIPQHVLRFWETKFSQVKPMKRGGGRRYYRPDDVNLLRRIRDLLYSEGYTIRGVQKLIKEQGVKTLISDEVEDSPAENNTGPAIEVAAADVAAGDVVLQEQPGLLSKDQRETLGELRDELVRLRGRLEG